MNAYQRHNDAAEPDLPKSGQSPSMHRTMADAVCTGCGCACDDIQLSVADGRIIAAERACDLGKTWFLRPRDSGEPPATIDGLAATIDAAVSAAAQLLAAVRLSGDFWIKRHKLSGSTLGRLDRRLAGCRVDSRTSVEQGPSAVAFSGVGEVTCSLGEASPSRRPRDLLGANPSVSHPRHAERYSLDPIGMFVPAGRAGRTCVVVDVQETESAERRNSSFALRPAPISRRCGPGALVKGLPLDADAVEEKTGVPLTTWQDLAERMEPALVLSATVRG